MLIVAVIAAIAAGGIAFSRDDDESTAAPETITVTATPPTPGEEEPAAPAAPPAGTYVGELVSVAEDTEGARMQAVATFGGETAMIVYPDQGCAVSLAPLTDELYSSTALTSDCEGTEGAWQVEIPESGLIEVTYSIHGEDQVTGTLSFGIPVDAE